MYVRFEQPPNDKDGTRKTVVLPGMGILIGRAAIGPVNPALDECELRNFGIWRNAADQIVVSEPAAGNNFPVLVPKTVAGKPSGGGMTQLTWLRDMIGELWTMHHKDEKFWQTRYDLLPQQQMAVAAKTTK